MSSALALIETGTAKTAKQGLGRRLRAGLAPKYPRHSPYPMEMIMPRPESETREAQQRKLEDKRARDWNQVFDAIEGKRV